MDTEAKHDHLHDSTATFRKLYHYKQEENEETLG